MRDIPRLYGTIDVLQMTLDKFTGYQFASVFPRAHCDFDVYGFRRELSTVMSVVTRVRGVAC